MQLTYIIYIWTNFGKLFNYDWEISNPQNGGAQDYISITAMLIKLASKLSWKQCIFTAHKLILFWFFMSQSTIFSHDGMGLPGLNQY